MVDYVQVPVCSMCEKVVAKGYLMYGTIKYVKDYQVFKSLCTDRQELAYCVDCFIKVLH